MALAWWFRLIYKDLDLFGYLEVYRIFGKFRDIQKKVKFGVLQRFYYFYEFTHDLSLKLEFEAQLSVRSGPVQQFPSRILYPTSLSKFTLNKWQMLKVRRLGFQLLKLNRVGENKRSFSSAYKVVIVIFRQKC